MPPAVRLAFAQGENEQERPRRHEQRTRHVDALAATRPRRLSTHEEQRAEDRERRHDHVDAKRPTPRVVGREIPADQRSERDGCARGGAPHPECGRPLAPVEGRREDAERGRHHQRRADAFDHGFAEDQRRHRCRHRREQRTDAEHSGADDEHAPRAEEVAEATPDDQQARERQRVSGDHPLQARQSRVEVPQDRRDRNVEDRRVERHDQHRADHDCEREPPSGIRSRLRLRRGHGNRSANSSLSVSATSGGTPPRPSSATFSSDSTGPCKAPSGASTRGR